MSRGRGGSDNHNCRISIHGQLSCRRFHRNLANAINVSESVRPYPKDVAAALAMPVHLLCYTTSWDSTFPCLHLRTTSVAGWRMMKLRLPERTFKEIIAKMDPPDARFKRPSETQTGPAGRYRGVCRETGVLNRGCSRRQQSFDPVSLHIRLSILAGE